MGVRGPFVPTWDDFFMAQVGASAALAGLLFVGLSINLPKILANRSLPDRAEKALAVLVLILFESSLFLIPDQSATAFGTELLVTGLGGGGLVLLLSYTVLRDADPPYRRPARAELGYATAVVALYVLGGALTVVGSPYGTFPFVPAVLLSYLTALLDAWVLLVEINR